MIDVGTGTKQYRECAAQGYTPGIGLYLFCQSGLESFVSEGRVCDGTQLERLRYLMILLEGKQTLYPYDELGSEGVLYTAFNVWLQVAGEETACRLFLRKGERRDS